MSRAGVNKDYLKKRNRGLVLQHIATERCVSRVSLPGDRIDKDSYLRDCQ